LSDLLYLANAQANNCTIESGIFNQGKATINYQFNTGFCKEWIIGPVSKQQVHPNFSFLIQTFVYVIKKCLIQRITIMFLTIDIDCNNQDKLLLFNEDRSYLLYDYCSQEKAFSTGRNVVVSHSKYVLARLQTFSSKLLSVTFDMFLFDPPEQINPQLPEQFSFMTTTRPVPTSSSIFKFNSPSIF
jgi:hypothetical protein